jgi:hypothetical protein
MRVIVGMFVRRLLRGCDARGLFRLGQNSTFFLCRLLKKSPSRGDWETYHTILSLSRFEENGQTVGN